MPRGGKPKAEAIRRLSPERATIIERAPLPMPESVAENRLMRECWEWTVLPGGFTEADVPMLTLLAYWWAVARQCTENLSHPNGGIITKVETDFGEKQAADMRTLREATGQIRLLSSELGVGPLARSRMGLMKVATASMAVDLPAKVFKMLDDHYGD